MNKGTRTCFVKLSELGEWSKERFIWVDPSTVKAIRGIQDSASGKYLTQVITPDATFTVTEEPQEAARKLGIHLPLEQV
jgi:hypothetical protein